MVAKDRFEEKTKEVIIIVFYIDRDVEEFAFISNIILYTLIHWNVGITQII